TALTGHANQIDSAAWTSVPVEAGPRHLEDLIFGLGPARFGVFRPSNEDYSTHTSEQDATPRRKYFSTA
ncbi:hypothetical protein, partial [Brevibacterium ravenspurgense]|uniref:hypothetical protein n=1 Tax=Brevibacterium ravenspurgense TaxID=479117 RepID=UPI001AD80DF5